MALILCVQVTSLELKMLLSPFASWQFDRDRDSTLATFELQVDDHYRPTRPTHSQFSLMESYLKYGLLTTASTPPLCLDGQSSGEE